MIKRSFSELKRLKTFEEKFEYLRLNGSVGRSIFGFDRYMNQVFYKSRDWLSVRDHVIVRDNGCDLGVLGYEIRSKILIHHMNPITLEDLETPNPEILDPNFLITTTNETHQAIHYGDQTLLFKLPKERVSGDTKLW
jgi:hypothetical protein